MLSDRQIGKIVKRKQNKNKQSKNKDILTMIDNKTWKFIFRSNENMQRKKERATGKMRPNICIKSTF